MEELIKRLRDGTTVPLMEERHAVADALEAQQAEISSFCMNYRMKCDEEIKSLHKQLKEQEGYDGIAHDMERLRLGLENCRLLAAQHRKEYWALLILGFCAEAGVVGSITR